MSETKTQNPSSPNAQLDTTNFVNAVFDRRHGKHLDAATIQAAFTSLPARYPFAPVGAHTAEGSVVPMPDSVPLLQNPVLKARSGPDLIIRDELVLKGWVGRIGGDEFLAVCPDIGGPEQAMKLAGRLAEAQREAIRVARGEIVVQAGIGVAWSSGEGAEADAMVAKADRAMYEPKHECGGQPKLPTERAE